MTGEGNSESRLSRILDHFQDKYESVCVTYDSFGSQYTQIYTHKHTSCLAPTMAVLIRLAIIGVYGHSEPIYLSHIVHFGTSS